MTGRRPRPWRAKAYGSDPLEWTRRQVVARASACTEDGLAGFRARHEAAGRTVDVYELLTADELDPTPPATR